MKHDLYNRDDGLAHCKVCGGAEGSLPTHCPGRRMTAEEQDAVYAQQLDFRFGKWWVPVEPLTDARIDAIAEAQREEYGQLCDAEDLRMFARAARAARL